MVTYFLFDNKLIVISVFLIVEQKFERARIDQKGKGSREILTRAKRKTGSETIHVKAMFGRWLGFTHPSLWLSESLSRDQGLDLSAGGHSLDLRAVVSSSNFTLFSNCHP